MIDSTFYQIEFTFAALLIFLNNTGFLPQVFSDEFQTEGRIFTDGEDPKWNALDKNDCKYSAPLSSQFIFYKKCDSLFSFFTEITR